MKHLIGSMLATTGFATLAVATPAGADVVAMNQPAESVTAERIAKLPAAQRRIWTAYLTRSQAQMRADKASLAAERRPGMPIPPAPPGGNGVLTMPLDRDAAWYRSDAARHVADVVLSFQTPAGGWSKNQPRNGARRLPGQPYVGDNSNGQSTPGDFDASAAWHYVGTIDNDATTHEIRFLARMARNASGADAVRYRTGVDRGVRYLLNAQYPHGGWPQVWPLEGKYHDAITLNDDAMTQVLDLMTDVGTGVGDFASVAPALRKNATAAAARGLDCILRLQVVVNGRRTGWGQQHDALTLKITSARNYEPAALAAPESAALLRYLMGLPRRTPAITTAIDSGVAWLRATAIHGQAWRDANDGKGRSLHADPNAPLLWARFYTVEGNRPIFGDRDKTLHDDVMELSGGRRRGYAWYGTAPNAALERYAAWQRGG